MRILIKGDHLNSEHPQSHLIGAHEGPCPPYWVGIYVCKECHTVFEVKNDPHIYQGNTAEDPSCACPKCGNSVTLGSSVRLNRMFDQPDEFIKMLRKS